MIPLCSREHVEYTDIDGTSWKFKPLTGDLQYVMASFRASLRDGNLELEELKKTVDSICEKAIVSCKVGKKVFALKELMVSLTFEEKTIVIGQIWEAANRLTDDEKKV
jgi:hypothetical protein